MITNQQEIININELEVSYVLIQSNLIIYIG